MDVFETTENLIQEILDELLFKRSGCKESVKIGTKEFGDEVTDEQA